MTEFLPPELALSDCVRRQGSSQPAPLLYAPFSFAGVALYFGRERGFRATLSSLKRHANPDGGAPKARTVFVALLLSCKKKKKYEKTTGGLGWWVGLEMK